MINSDFMNNMAPTVAFQAVAKKLGRLGAANENQLPSSRPGRLPPKMLGLPIPVVHCKTCGVVPVAKSELPVALPSKVNFDKPGNPLDR